MQLKQRWLAQPIIPVMMAKMKPIVPSQSKSPASVPRLAEISGSILVDMIGLLVNVGTANDGARVRFLRRGPVQRGGLQIEAVASAHRPVAIKTAITVVNYGRIKPEPVC